MTPLTIPSLPTDNLYKFLALSGLLICVFSTVLFIWEMQKLSDQSFLIQEENRIFKVEAEFINKDQDRLIDKMNSLQKKLEDNLGPDEDWVQEKPWERKNRFYDRLLNDKDYREYVKFTFDYQLYIFPELKERDEIAKIVDTLQVKGRELERKDIEISISQQRFNAKNSQIEQLKWFYFVLFGAGFALSLGGFTLWYQKVQKLADHKLTLELEILKSKIAIGDSTQNEKPPIEDGSVQTKDPEI